jgi:type VI secretion system protein ImpG
MDKGLLRHYERELVHLRETAGEFAKEFPKIAGRLGLEQLECADPYVERLLEGFAYMAARVQQKMDSEFPEFTGALLEMVSPHYLCPTPSMTVVQFNTADDDSGLAGGYPVPRGTSLRSRIGPNEQTPCTYRTAHDVTLLPIRVTEASYHTRDIGSLDMPQIEGARPKAVVRLKLRSTADLAMADLSFDRLDFYLHGQGAIPYRLFEQIIAGAWGDEPGVIVREPVWGSSWHEVLPKRSISRLGLDDDQSLLSLGPQSFHGYRLVHEYFAFPQRFLFIAVEGLARSLTRCEGAELELLILLDTIDEELESAVDADQFRLGCTPAINLFPKRSDRIHVTDRFSAFHVVPDRTRPLDYEVYNVSKVTGYAADTDDETTFLPFYAMRDDRISAHGTGAFFSTSRRPRAKSDRERRTGPRSSYAGTEVYVSLVDSDNAPYRGELKQLGADALCTNRDLPLRMPVGQGRTDFTTEVGASIESVRCLAGPTAPRPSFAQGAVAWRLVNHLSLNALSLVDGGGEGGERGGREGGAAGLREVLGLYADAAEPQIRRQIAGITSVSTRPITRRVPTPGRITFARGIEVTVTFDELSFEGTGCFVLSGVLERFLAKYVSINSFTELVARSAERGEIMRWRARIGTRHNV